VSAANVTASNGPDDNLRESWRQVTSMRRSTQRFRARVGRTLPYVQMAMTADLDRLRLPEELFEVIA
jgi:hypothetical protein